MAKVYLKGDSSTGACTYPPTPLTSMVSKKTFIAGKLIGTVGAKHTTQTKPDSPPHPTGIRNITSGASKSYCAGQKIARPGDSIGCGDTCGASSASKTYCG